MTTLQNSIKIKYQVLKVILNDEEFPSCLVYKQIKIVHLMLVLLTELYLYLFCISRIFLPISTRSNKQMLQGDLLPYLESTTKVMQSKIACCLLFSYFIDANTTQRRHTASGWIHTVHLVSLRNVLGFYTSNHLATHISITGAFAGRLSFYFLQVSLIFSTSWPYCYAPKLHAKNIIICSNDTDSILVWVGLFLFCFVFVCFILVFCKTNYN